MWSAAPRRCTFACVGVAAIRTSVREYGEKPAAERRTTSRNFSHVRRPCAACPRMPSSSLDSSTGGVKALAFDLSGQTVPRRCGFHRSVDRGRGIGTEPDAARRAVPAATRAIADALANRTRRKHWIACGISATHHTAGRIDWYGNQVRRAIC